jgi:hypothetical protein
MLVYVELLIFANFILDYISYILLFLHISKAPPRLTLYRLKGKKGVSRLDSPYHLKNYALNHIRIFWNYFLDSIRSFPI